MSQSSANSPITNQVKVAFEKTLPLTALDNLTTLVAVSGGPDSVALADFLVQNKSSSSRICLAHFNHQLRGAESDADEYFVRLLSQSLGCELWVRRAGEGNSVNEPESFSAENSNHGEGLESLARRARYQFIREVASEIGARFVATAHTQDDQIETVVHRFFRGTGIRGLVGIPPARQLISGVSLIRPFLGCRKSSLLRYLEERGLEYRTDSSNQTDQFTRNRIRAELLPLVNTIFENDPSSSVLSIAEQSSEFIHWIDSQMDRLIEDYVVLDSNSVQIQMDPSITSLPTIVVNELWIRIWIEMGWPRQQMSRDKWNALSHLTNKVHLTNHATEQKKISLPGHLLAERLSDHLVIWDASEDPN